MNGWLRDRRTLNDAAAWYARMQEPGSAEEVAAFEAWLSRDPAHARAYAELDAVSQAAGKVPARPVATQRQRRPIAQPVLVVAVLALALVSAALLWPSVSSPAFAAISNPGPAVRGVQLADGTTVWLDSGAEIGVRQAETGSEIAVRRGRVRIVPHGADTPVAVSAGNVTITPNATKLDVTVSDAGVAIGALDGPLTANGVPGSATHTLRIEPGGARVIDAKGARTASLDRSWPASRVRFKGEPLARVVALANRQGDPDIRVPDPALAALHVSGVFDLRETRSLARKLAATFDLDVAERDGALELHR
jgi:transmembrane sensor